MTECLRYFSANDEFFALLVSTLGLKFAAFPPGIIAGAAAMAGTILHSEWCLSWFVLSPRDDPRSTPGAYRQPSRNNERISPMTASQAAYAAKMSEPRTLTLTRAEMEMVQGLVFRAFHAYRNLPGEKAAGDILSKIQEQCPDCVAETYSGD